MRSLRSAPDSLASQVYTNPRLSIDRRMAPSDAPAGSDRLPETSISMPNLPPIRLPDSAQRRLRTYNTRHPTIRGNERGIPVRPLG